MGSQAVKSSRCPSRLFKSDCYYSCVYYIIWVTKYIGTVARCETLNEKNNYFRTDGSDVLNMLTTGHSPIPIQYTGCGLFEIRLNMTD